MNIKQDQTFTFLTLSLAVLFAVTSFFGAFFPSTYQHDSASMAAQGMGQDLVNLFIAIPLFIVAWLLMRNGCVPSTFFFGGTLLYILYSIIIYAFGVHLNFLFLFYCAILGVSLYLFILYLVKLNALEVESWFKETYPAGSLAVFFVIIAVLFYALWLKDVMPAVLSGILPASVEDNALPVNPVHVLDMAIFLPGLILTALFLRQRKRLGYVFAPLFLIFLLILTAALIAMVIMLKVKGIEESMAVAVVFVFLAVISGVMMLGVLKSLKSTKLEKI